MSSPVPTDQNLNEYKEALLIKKGTENNEFGKSQITKENFITTPAWFDESERNKDRPNSYKYSRVKNLKSIIFDTIKEDSELGNLVV